MTLHDLSPSTSYFVRVLAVGCDGTRGKPSPWIGVYTGTPSGGAGAGAVAATPSSATQLSGTFTGFAAATGASQRRQERDEEMPGVDDVDDDAVNDEQGKTKLYESVFAFFKTLHAH